MTQHIPPGGAAPSSPSRRGLNGAPQCYGTFPKQGGSGPGGNGRADCGAPFSLRDGGVWPETFADGSGADLESWLARFALPEPGMHAGRLPIVVTRRVA